VAPKKLILFSNNRWRSMQVLQAMGYAVPPVSFIGGNLLELVSLFYDTSHLFVKDKSARVFVFGQTFSMCSNVSEQTWEQA
jgi:hypothetical protein